MQIFVGTILYLGIIISTLFITHQVLTFFHVKWAKSIQYHFFYNEQPFYGCTWIYAILAVLSFIVNIYGNPENQIHVAIFSGLVILQLIFTVYPGIPFITFLFMIVFKMFSVLHNKIGTIKEGK